MESILEREKSQTQIQVHRRSKSMRENSSTKMALHNESSKIPAKIPTTKPPAVEKSPTKSKKDNAALPPTKTDPPGKKSQKEPTKRRENRPKHPPPVRPPPAEVTLERELTQTIMSVQQIKESGGFNPTQVGMPVISPPPTNKPTENLTISTETLTQACSPTPTLVAESAKLKPRSVVRPMPKQAEAKAVAARKVTIQVDCEGKYSIFI